MVEQLELQMGEQMGEQVRRKPKMTAKLKREAISALMQQVKGGWDPPDSVWKLIDWLSIELTKKK